MKHAIILLAALLAAPAMADYVGTHGADSVRLTDKPCAGPVAALVGEQARQLRAGSAVVAGTLYEVCWIPMPQASGVLLLYPDGDQGFVPFSDLHKAPEV